MKRVFALTLSTLAAASAAYGQTTTRSATLYQRRVEQELIKLDEDWGRALQSADAKTL